MPGSVANYHSVPFSPSAETAKTVNKTVKCGACDKPRVIYSAHKFTTQDHMILKRILGLYQYSFGCEFQELMLQEREKAQNKKYLPYLIVFMLGPLYTTKAQ